MANGEELSFNVQEFLGSKGLTLKAVEENGNIIAADKEGNELDFDPREFLAAQQVDPNNVDIELNTKNTAIDKSPLSLIDRAKVASGNVKGSLNFLRAKFSEVDLDEDQGIVVKDTDGLWKKIDPNILKGDAWDISEAMADLVELGVELGPNIAASIKGASFGAAIGLATPVPGGAIAGSIVGAGLGGAFGETIRTSLGRLVGTFEATPTEQLRDIALEGIFTLGGQGLALGVRPTVKGLFKAFKAIGSKPAAKVAAVKANVSDGTKEVISQVYGPLTGTGPQAYRVMLEKTDDVAKAVATNLKGASQSQAIEKMTANSNNLTRSILERGTKALPEKYGQLLDDLGTKAKDITFDIQKNVSSAQRNIIDSGFGKLDKSGKFVELGPDDISLRTGRGLEIESLDPKTFRQVKKIYDTLQAFSRIRPLKGKAGTRALTGINRTLNKIQTDSLKGDVPEAVGRAVNKAASGFRQSLGETFESAGLGKEYFKLSQLYDEFGAAVVEGRRILKKDTIEQLSTKMASASDKNLKAKGLVEKLVQLGGKKSEKEFGELVILDTAKKFVPIVPKVGLLQLGAGAGGFGLGGGGIVSLTQLSPRVSLRQREATKMLTGALGQTNELFKKMTVGQMKQALESETFMRTVFSEALQSVSRSEQLEEQLVEGAIGQATQQ